VTELKTTTPTGYYTHAPLLNLGPSRGTRHSFVVIPNVKLRPGASPSWLPAASTVEAGADNPAPPTVAKREIKPTDVALLAKLETKPIH
jgi:hypothetical protein